MDHPNIVLIHAHDLGRQLGCYDRDVETPHIDAIAEEGIRFDEFFCTAPQCSPSRGSLWTGQYPHEVGLMGLVNRGWRLNEDVQTLPQLLRTVGYETRLFGVQHVVPNTDEQLQRIGYDDAMTEATRAREVATRFADALPNFDSGPFFASIGFQEPHLPFRREYVDQSVYEQYQPSDVSPLPYLPDRREVREDIAEMNGLISGTVDPAVGRIDDVLHEAGIANDTLFVFTADHGIPFPHAKGSLTDPGIEIPLIMRGPKIEAGIDDTLLSNVDLLPTILDYIGEAAPDISGQAFSDLLTTDRDLTPREHVFAELTYHADYHPTRAVRTENHKYIRNFDHGPRVHLPTDVYSTRSGEIVRDEIYTDRRPAEELYNLATDPNEAANLISDAQITDADPLQDKESAENAVALRTTLYEWMERTGDPLLDGPIAPPAHPRPPFEF